MRFVFLSTPPSFSVMVTCRYHPYTGTPSPPSVRPRPPAPPTARPPPPPTSSPPPAPHGLPPALRPLPLLFLRLVVLLLVRGLRP